MHSRTSPTGSTAGPIDRDGTMVKSSLTGIGMTSARTRERLIARLREQGIENANVLDRIRAGSAAHVRRRGAGQPRLRGHGPADRSCADHLATVHRRAHDGGAARPVAPRKVLEVGTGCGYQTAVLAPLVVTVYSVERIVALQQRARQALRDLKIRNVHLRHGDGFEGWAAYAPFDGILVAAASHSVPKALLDQLANGGRLIIPVGPIASSSSCELHARGELFERERLGPVTFVPLLQGLS
jgi:protein-L-isoaspartate(D-aspartate) O-methyltransferase